MSEISQILEAVQALEQKLSSLEEARTKEGANLSEIEKKLAALGEEQHNYARQLLAIEQKGADKLAGGQKHMTLGQRFVSSEAFKNFREKRITRASLDAASPVTTPAGAVPTDYRGIKGEPELANVVTAEFPPVPTTSNSISYLKEKAFTNSAAETAEGAQKPESKMEFEIADAPVRTIPHFIRVTKQLADDAPALAAYIDLRMMYGLKRRIEKQLLVGDGTGENLKGIFAEGNYTPHGFTAENLPEGSTVLDMIRRCASTMALNGYRARAVFLNPMDWDSLLGMKDSNGNYILGRPTESGESIRPWGLRVIASPEVVEGKFMVADTVMGATAYERQAPVLEMFEQDSDNVQKNLYTIRVECRMAFAVETANAFIGGDLSISGAAAKSAKVGIAQVDKASVGA